MLDFYLDECEEVCTKYGQIDEWLYGDRDGVYFIDDEGEPIIKIGYKI